MRKLSSHSEGALASWSVLQRTVAALLLAMHALLAWSLRVPGLTTGHDDAWYLSLARALSVGTYAELPIVGTPTHSMYPPLYPVLLALLGVHSPEQIAAGVVFNIVLSVLALAVAALFAARFSPWLAVLMLLVCAPNPLLLERASSITSEPLFMVAIFAALLWLSDEHGPATPFISTATRPHTHSLAQRQARTLVLGSIAVLAATLTRSIGVSLLLATLAHWLLNRQWRRVAALTVVGALTTGAWLLWTVRAPRLDAGRSYIADAVYTGGVNAEGRPTATSAASPTVAPPSMARVIAMRLRQNVPWYATRALPSAFAMPTVRDTLVDNVLSTALMIGGALVGLLIAARTSRLLVLFVVMYVGILLVWPYVITRFLAPLLPLLSLLVLLGVGWSTGRMAGVRATRVVVSGVGFLLAAGALWRDRVSLRAMSMCDRSTSVASTGCFTNEQRDFFAAAALAKQVTPHSARFLSSKEATLYQLTGRQSVRESRAIAMTEPEQFARFLADERVDYILLSRLHLDQWSLAERLSARCADYAVVQSFGAHVSLLKVRALGDSVPATTSDACAAIDRWALGDWESER